MITTGLDHVAIAVMELENSIKSLEIITGHPCQSIETIKEQDVVSAHFNLNGVNIELISPLSSGSALERFLSRNGEGLHHIALSVSRIDDALEELQEKGITLIDRTSQVGANNKQIGFIHPKNFANTLIEFCSFY